MNTATAQTDLNHTYQQVRDLALSIAHRYAHQYSSLSVEDAEGMAQEALWRAVRKYDPQRGELPVYAARVVRNEFREYLRQNARGAQCTDTFTNFLSDEETVGSGAEYTEFLADDVDTAEQAIYSIRCDQICVALATLPAKHQQAVAMRFGVVDDPATYVEIGERLGCSGTWASEITKRGIRMLRERLV